MTDLDERVLVLMPTVRDGERTARMLSSAGLACAVCKDMNALCEEVARGAGAVLLTEEAVSGDRAGGLASTLKDQPQWSDIPLVVIAREGGADAPIREAMNATLVERPVKMRSLVSVVRAALRTRHRQYELRDHLAERQRVEEELRRKDANLTDFIENATVGMHWVGPGGTILWANQAEIDLLGYAREEYVGRNIAEFHADPPVIEDILCKLTNKEHLHGYEARMRCKDGSIRHVEINSSVLWDGDRFVHTRCFTRDVTEQKWADDALRESEERFRLMADAVPVLIWVSDQSKGCAWFNKSWLDFAGRPMQELVGNGWADDVHPDDLARCLDVYNTNFDARRPFTMDYRLKRHDGEYRWVEDNGTPRFDGEGVFAGYIGSCVDFTDRKGAEEELRRLAADLSETDRKKDDFIALLAHELRNPLAPIRNGLQVLRRTSEPESRERSQEMMDRQLTHMVRLIDDLLDVSRIGRNKMELRRERVTLVEVVASAVETAQPAIEAAGHQLSVTLPGKPVDLDADLTRLAQVFSNLLTNSAKYTHRGGRIWLTGTQKGDSVSVSVRDNGIGIPAAALHNIFDMFSQVDRSIERSTGGLGIGLALVKGLTEMHGGTVTVESEGQGTTFTVNLPVLPARTQIPASAKPTATQHVTAHRILVVDDNRDGAESLSQLLEVLGHQVATAYDGMAAVEQAEKFRPDLILMDVGMPRMNGYEATQRIREHDWGAEMTIIALTGWGQEGDRKLSQEAGCNSHLVKPVSLPDLERKLEELNGET